MRWPEGLWLLNSAGEIVLGRCKATNLCPYCQTLFVVETMEMLWLDAEKSAPSIYVVLTAREHLTRKDCTDHLRQLRRSLKRRWERIEWFVQVEFQRRGALHLNLLVKGVDVDDQEQLHNAITERWCDRVDAEPSGQWSGPISEAGGLARYLQKNLAHGLKREQAPPLGWKGHRTSQTRGYFPEGAAAMREQARRSLRFRRELYRAEQAGHAGHDAHLAAAEALELADALEWRLWRQSLKRVHTEPAREPVLTGLPRAAEARSTGRDP